MMLIHTCACIQMSSNRNKKKAKKTEQTQKSKFSSCPQIPTATVFPRHREPAFLHTAADQSWRSAHRTLATVAARINILAEWFTSFRADKVGAAG